MVNEEETRASETGDVALGLLATWRRVVTDPLGFLADMPETGGLREPGLYLVACVAVAAVGKLVWSWSLFGALGYFVIELVDAVVLATLIVLIAQNLFEGRAGFEPTFRVVAYAWSPLVLFTWLGGLGGITVLYAAYIAVRGVERVHRIDTLRAVLTVLIAGAGLAVLRRWLV